MKDGDILLLENTRFYKGEEKNEPAFVEGLAKLGDLYVNDAFSAAHRAHASTEGVAHKLPAFAGRAMQAELEALTIALGNPERPVAAIVGGAKVSTKLELLGNLIKKVDVLIIGGGMANTFLFAQGKAIGKSLCEKDMADTAREILADADGAKCRIILPVDATVAKEFKAHAPRAGRRRRSCRRRRDDPRHRAEVGRRRSRRRLARSRRWCGTARSAPSRRRHSRRRRSRSPRRSASSPARASSSRSPAAATRSRR